MLQQRPLGSLQRDHEQVLSVRYTSIDSTIKFEEKKMAAVNNTGKTKGFILKNEIG
jgi:hypothetical protein